MKNIISNIIGVILVGLSVYGLLYLDLERIDFTLLMIIGLACFYFENSTIKKYIKKFLDSKIK
jgi:hypothetical protein